MKQLSQTIYLLFSVLVSMIGYHIHHSIFWGIIDLIFSPLALIKWLYYHEITLTIIKDTFNWFFI